jgi:hypothetical protein
MLVYAQGTSETNGSTGSGILAFILLGSWCGGDNTLFACHKCVAWLVASSPCASEQVVFLLLLV